MRRETLEVRVRSAELSITHNYCDRLDAPSRLICCVIASFAC